MHADCRKFPKGRGLKGLVLNKDLSGETANSECKKFALCPRKFAAYINTNFGSCDLQELKVGFLSPLRLALQKVCRES